MLKSKIKVIIYHNNVLMALYNIWRDLQEQKQSKFSDAEFAEHLYKKFRGKGLNLESPETYDEKLWYLNLKQEELELKKKCTDKVTVREYVEQCGLKDILNEVYGVYDSFEEIPFTELPETVFLKCAHRSGANALYKKGEFDYQYHKNSFDYWMKKDYYKVNRERNYKGLKPHIICEKVLRDEKGKLPLDYKFFCFHGTVRFLTLEIGCASETGAHSEEYFRNVYDCDFNLLPVRETREIYLGEIKKPQNFDMMLNYAEILSAPFRHCRVDLYNIAGKIYFGEITFYHGAGCNHFIPESWERKIGDWIDISGL